MSTNSTKLKKLWSWWRWGESHPCAALRDNPFYKYSLIGIFRKTLRSSKMPSLESWKSQYRYKTLPAFILIWWHPNFSYQESERRMVTAFKQQRKRVLEVTTHAERGWNLPSFAWQRYLHVSLRPHVLRESGQYSICSVIFIKSCRL